MLMSTQHVISHLPSQIALRLQEGMVLEWTDLCNTWAPQIQGAQDALGQQIGQQMLAFYNEQPVPDAPAQGGVMKKQPWRRRSSSRGAQECACCCCSSGRGQRR